MEGMCKMSATKQASKQATAVGPVTNGAADVVGVQEPYSVSLTLTGTTDILFCRFNCEEVEAKARAPKNSKAKKTDNLENYIWRNDAGDICIPGEYLRMSTVLAAKFRQDPRSPRKSAMDLYKAGFLVNTEYASLGRDRWDYEHKAHAVVQRNGIVRTRPAFKAGWATQFTITVLLPEYIAPTDLHDVITQAGKLCGLGDYRPTYGRFAVTNFEVLRAT
jgi:hypothetical protein